MGVPEHLGIDSARSFDSIRRMSEREMSRNLRWLAIGAAVLAMVFACVAVIVVVTRGGESAPPSTKAEQVLPLRDHAVAATDVARLRKEVEVVIDTGVVQGLRVKDAALAKALGLEAGDVITSISGKPMTSERDAVDVMADLRVLGPTKVYVEIARGGEPVLLRWQLDGDLRKAHLASPLSTSSAGSGGSGAIGSMSAGSGGLDAIDSTPATDPVLDAIVRVDDTHSVVPRATADAILGDPLKYSKGARIVPSVRNGQPDGLKLYAIRPSSVFRKVGFENGDMLRAVNGMRITTVDTMLEVYAKVRDANELRLEVLRRGRPVVLTVEISK